MGAATFGSRATLGRKDGADLAISGDRQALTLSLAEMETVVEAGKSPDLIAARVFSAVAPVDGVDIAFAVDAIASVTEGASTDAVLSVNGQTAVRHFSAGTFESFVQQLSFKGPTKPCHLAVVAVVQRDPAYPDAAATLRPSPSTLRSNHPGEVVAPGKSSARAVCGTELIGRQSEH